MELRIQRDIFNIFHDGRIQSFERHTESILLKIEIELLGDSTDTFFLKLIKCTNLFFYVWDDENRINDLNLISNLNPEILSCDESVKDHVRVFCSLEYGTGGELNIITSDIEIFDDAMNKISYKKLCKIYDNYWSNF